MNNPSFSKKDNYTRCKNSAIYSLAMREHSRKEITNKLLQKDYVSDVDITKLLDELEAKNYLNEQRFTESFIRSRSLRGQGPIKISYELMKKGITSNLSSRIMNELAIDWYQKAEEQIYKKYGQTKPQDFKEKVKQMRFLSGRGFDSEMVRSLFS